MISVQRQVLLTKPRSGVIFTLQQTENEKIEHGFPFGADKRYLIEFVQHGIRSGENDKAEEKVDYLYNYEMESLACTTKENKPN